MTVSQEEFENLISSIQNIDSKMKRLLSTKNEKQTEQNSDIQLKLRQKLMRKIKKKRDNIESAEVKSLMTNLLKQIKVKNLEETMKLLNTLKTCFPQRSFNRLIIDCFSYSILLYGNNSEFIDVFNQLDELTQNVSSSYHDIIDHMQISSTQDIINSCVEKIKSLLRNKLFNTSSSDTTNEIKKDLKEIKNMLTIHPVFPEEELQSAFDSTLKSYMENIQMEHNAVIEELKNQISRLENKNESILNDNEKLHNQLNEINEYNISLYKDYATLKSKYQSINGHNRISFIDLATQLYETLEKQNKDKEEELNITKSDLDSIKNQLEKAQIELQNVRNELDCANNTIIQKDSEMTKINKSKNDMEAELKTIKTKLDKKEFQVNDIKRREKIIEERTAKIIELEANNIELNAKLKTLQEKEKNSKSNAISVPRSKIVSHDYSETLNKKIIYLQQLTEQSMNDIPAQKLYIAQQIQKELEVQHLQKEISDLKSNNNLLESKIDFYTKYGYFDEQDTQSKQYKEKVHI